MRLSKEIDLENKVILVTGGAGFLGSHVVNLLKKENPKKIIIPRSTNHDLREKSACKELVKNVDIVIHLAAKVGGIGYNQEHPAELFYDNLIMGTNMMHEAYLARVQKFVSIGTICAYPKITPVPFKEEDLWNGYPEETNAPYGLAKKMQLVQSQAYRNQYGFNSIYLLPTNLYGPGDNFNPKSSHVIPALIKKFVEATSNNEKEVIVWGTGNPTREFLYVEDAARAIILATKKCNSSEPVNLGSSSEISIANLAKLIGELSGFKGKITFDKSKPDGQLKRKISTKKALKEFGFVSKVPFNKGLKKTIEWYKKEQNINTTIMKNNFFTGLIENKDKPIKYLYLRIVGFIEKAFTYYYLKKYGVETKYGYVKLVGFPIIRKHPFSTIKIGQGVVLVSNTSGNILGINHPTILATLHKDAKIIIGKNSGLSGASVISVDSITIGENVGIGANCYIYDSDFHAINSKSRKSQKGIQDLRKAKYLPIKIGNDVFIGLGALILKGVTIGSEAIVGAGSIVTKNIKRKTIVAGNPAKFIRNIS